MHAPVLIFQPFERKVCVWPQIPAQTESSGHGSGPPSLMKTNYQDVH